MHIYHSLRSNNTLNQYLLTSKYHGYSGVVISSLIERDCNHPDFQKLILPPMTRQTPPLTPAQNLYIGLMEEAKLRIHAMRDAINARNSWLPRLLQEFLYLQLRMLCETIAVGCLIAHGNIKRRDLLKAWKAPDIIEKLETLSTDFYPRGIRLHFEQDGVRGLYFDDNKAPQLSKSELIKLWEGTGAFLHRGSASKLLAENGKPVNVNLDAIIEDATKIQHLLEQHVISSADKKTHFIVALAHVESGGKAMLWVGASP